MIKYIIFDIILFFIIFPYLIKYKNKYFIYNLVITSIICCHFVILYERYYLNKEIQWTWWCECISMFFGAVILIDGNYNKNMIICIAGILIISAHFKKLIDPSLSYYYS